jgi:hypothetical protein
MDAARGLMFLPAGSLSLICIGTDSTRSSAAKNLRNVHATFSWRDITAQGCDGKEVGFEH